MNWFGIIALCCTGLLGLIGAIKWGKISQIIDIIKDIFLALEDKSISEQEAKTIWEKIKKL